MSKLALAEQFYSIQGEGRHAGIPAVFLRLAGCNLTCGGRENLQRDPDEMEPEGDATWVCDTIDVWRAAERVVEPEELVDEWEARGWLQSLSEGAHLVLTGGEPLMPRHQKSIKSLIAEFIAREGGSPYVEVETNGTVEPEFWMARYINQYNVSLKLSNSGMPEEERIIPSAIHHYQYLNDSDDRNVDFKFVVGDEGDVDEIHDLIDKFEIDPSMVMLMPAGSTQDQLAVTYPLVVELCKEHGYRFSPRLHVNIWDQATGV